MVAPHQGVPGKCPGRNTSALAAALTVNSGNNKILHKVTSTVDATDDLSTPCPEQRAGAATVYGVQYTCNLVVLFYSSTLLEQ